MARSNGGIIGTKNITSFGKNIVQIKTADGNLTATQANTRLVNVLVVGGGGSGGNTGGPSNNIAGGGGGA